MVLQHFGKLGRIGERARCRSRRVSIRVGEPLPKECVDPLLLFELLAGNLRVAEAEGRISGLAVHQNLGGVALAVGFERILELPFGATDLAAGKRSREPVAGKAVPRRDHRMTTTMSVSCGGVIKSWK